MATVDQPIDIAVTPLGGLVLSGGDITFTRGLDAVAQSIWIAVNEHKGEIYYDLERGIPYFERDGVSRDEALLGGKFDEAYTCAIFAATIRKVADVVSIDSIRAIFDRTTRALNVRWTVQAVFGTINGNTQFTV